MIQSRLYSSLRFRAVSISKLHRHHRLHRPHSTASLACERENLRATPSRRLSFARLISPVTRSRQNRPLHNGVLRLLPATGLHSLSLPRPSMIRRIRRLVSILMQAEIFLQSVLGIILGGAAGTRLYPLTKKRAKLVPLGANYRLIDIPVRNCLNRNISKIYVLTQFNSASLNHHLSWAYTSNMGGYKNEGFVEFLAAQQSPKNPNWFQGTAGAVRQYLWLFEEHNVLEFLILTGDQNFGSSIPNLLLDCCQGTYDEFHLRLQLIDYNPDVLDESVLWTESRDLGDGHRTIRMVNNIRLNVDAFNGDKNHGGVHDGTTIVLWEWKKGDNQRWKIVPYLILWSSQGGNASGEESDNIDWDTEDELEIQNFPFAVFGATKLWQLQQVLDACKMELNPEIIADIDKHTIVMKLLYYDDVTVKR
ncbi:unnamed protein product [Camellia sinensis]